MSEFPKSVLIANRGEIARRISRTVKRLGIRAVVTHSALDVDLPFVQEADESFCLGDANPSETYLNIERILRAARETGCDAIHPGYGFLSESADLARAAVAEGLMWVGPDAYSMEAMGDKVRAKQLVATAGVPVGSGTGLPLADAAQAQAEAELIGYPVMLKASAGGGGIGMSLVEDPNGIEAALMTTRSRSERAFGSAEVFMEKYIAAARHVEVQILGLSDGTVVALGERDCSVQRRHQKIVEETPSPGVSEALRCELESAAKRAAEAVAYKNAGTVEFLLDVVTGQFTFLEMNTRLQVEHPVTELVTGMDLVEEQLRIAASAPASFHPNAVPTPRGHAIEMRVYAEDSRKFLPSPGQITRWAEPVGENVRVDSGYTEGNTVTPFYDPLLAKLCVYGEGREEALDRASWALGEFRVDGIKTNLEFLRRLVRSEEFRSGSYDTGIVHRVQSHPGT